MRSSARFFSVVVPVYDVAPYVGECLGSVLAQTCADWECLCVDDGSRDGSGVLLDAYARRDPRFRITHQRNAGVSAARNRVLDVVRGEWLCFLDGDDALHPGLLAQCRAAAAEGVDVVTFRSGYGAIVAFPDLEEPSVRMGDGALTMGLLNGGFAERVYRFACAPELRFGTYGIGEDRLFSAQWLCRVQGFAYLDACLYWYRARSGSATLSPLNLRKVADEFETGRRMLRLFLSNGNRIPRSAIRGECVRVFERTAFRLLALGRPWDSPFWGIWLEGLRELGEERGLSWWYRHAFEVCGRGRKWWLCVALAVLPYRMKLTRNRIYSVGKRWLRGWKRQ